MAGMEGLGRLFNVIPIATAKAFVLRDCSAVTFILTGNDTWTLTASATFGGTYANLAVITRYYTNTATDGTAGWVKATQAAAATIAQTTGATAFTVFGSQLPDPKMYLKVTVGASGLTTAIVHDLTVQRAPANLAKLGA